MKKLTLMASIVLLTLGAAGTANATIATVFNNWSDGLTHFNNTVANAGGTATHDNWSSLAFSNGGKQLDRTDYTVTKTDGGTLRDYGVYTAYGSRPAAYTTGQTISIDPAGTSTDTDHGANDGLGSKGSGLNFAFDNAINAIGFEVGDWSTCCQVSDIYISFGSNAPIRVGHSAKVGDQYLTNGGAGAYVAAFDDSGDFDTVHFWGDGWGEVLVMGGTISYALLDQGSLPPVGVPEPAPLVLFGLGLVCLGMMARRRRWV